MENNVTLNDDVEAVKDLLKFLMGAMTGCPSGNIFVTGFLLLA
jgi:hypothetical protein